MELNSLDWKGWDSGWKTEPLETLKSNSPNLSELNLKCFMMQSALKTLFELFFNLYQLQKTLAGKKFPNFISKIATLSGLN